MTANEAMNSVISLALNEVGYLEKKSNASLDDKTANAGSFILPPQCPKIPPSDPLVIEGSVAIVRLPVFTHPVAVDDWLVFWVEGVPLPRIPPM